MRTVFTIVAFVVAFSGSANVSHAQQINVPGEIIDGEHVPVTIEGLPPQTDVRVNARRVDTNGSVFTSHAMYRSDAMGRIDPASTAAVSGDYSGTDAAGLFFSMAPDGTSGDNRGTISLTVIVNEKIVAARSASLIDLASRLPVEDISAFSGARLYRPKGHETVPVIIVLGGSEGGSGYGRSLGPKLAMLGYAAIALPYYNPGWTNEDLPGLPTAFSDVPVDRLVEVHRWIKSRSDLDARRIAILGASKGGEFAMIAAARLSWLRAVIGIVPSDVVWEGWGTQAAEGTSSSFAWNGKSLPFTPYLGMSETIAALSRGERRSLTAPHLEGRRNAPERAAAARIPIERYRGPIFLAGGDLDQIWPSGAMVRAIAERRSEFGLRTVSLSFAGAGHGLSGTGWEPMNFPGNDTVAADATARRIIWDQLKIFLRSVFKR